MKQVNKPASEQPAMHRRKLLGAAGTTGALVAAGTLLATRQGEPDAVTQAGTKAAPVQGDGYRLTEHVLRYYQTTKI